MSASDDDRPLLVCGQCKAIFRSGFSRCPSDGAELAPLVEDPFVGQAFAGRYQIERLAGQGAMGRVYQARHLRMPKNFAIKIMFGDLATDATMRARFQSEAEAASRLDHPNVVSVVDFGDTVGGIVYMVMDFVEGKSLATLLEDEGRMTPERVRRLMRQIASGLQHAHERGLVHRDLKTDNVVVVRNEEDETARIIDFGIAMFADPSQSTGKLTAVGVVIGTPAYMSPEQACGERVDHRSDLFSLGVMGYELLAGQKPFDGHPFEIARQNIVAIAPPIAERTPGADVPEGFEALISKLMAKSRDERVQTAQELVERLDALDMGGKSAPPRAKSAHPRPSWLDLSMERPSAPRPRARRAPLAAIAAFGALALGLGGYVVYDRSTSSAESLAPAPDPSPHEAAPKEALVARDPPASPRAEVLTAAPAPNAVAAEEDDPDEPTDPGSDRPKARKRRVRSADEVDLTPRLEEIADQINRVSRERGERAAAPYRDRFRRTRSLYTQALRDPSKRAAAHAELDRLSSELARFK